MTTSYAPCVISYNVTLTAQPAHMTGDLVLTNTGSQLIITDPEYVGSVGNVDITFEVIGQIGGENGPKVTLPSKDYMAHLKELTLTICHNNITIGDYPVGLNEK